MTPVQTATTPGATTQQAPLDPQSQAQVPFRQATVEQTGLMSTQTFTISTANQRNINPVLSGGYLFGLWLNLVATAAGNSAIVAYNEDAPWTAFSQIVLSDVNGQLMNLTGFELFVSNLADKLYASRYVEDSTDPGLYNMLGGNGATAGSFTTSLRVPVGINRRDLVGLVSNQDRNQIYTLRADLAPSTDTYATSPTTLPGAVLNTMIESYTVPGARSADGVPQGMVPDNYGTLHRVVAANAAAVPAGGSSIPHQLPEIGNTIRWIAFVFRMNGVRADANLAVNQPTQLQFQFGSQAVYTESYEYRRNLMRERYGFDFPYGILLYDVMHDFGDAAGSELGEDYWHTAQVQRAQLTATYPSTFGSTNNSLDIITDELTPAVIAA